MYISYSTLRKRIGFEVDVFVNTKGKSLGELRKEIVSHLPLPAPASSTAAGPSSEFDIDFVEYIANRSKNICS